jgi:hypothetical protein
MPGASISSRGTHSSHKGKGSIRGGRLAVTAAKKKNSTTKFDPRLVILEDMLEKMKVKSKKPKG